MWKSWILCFFGVKKSGISVFLVSVENGAGVNKMTNITYGWRVSPLAVIIWKANLPLPPFGPSYFYSFTDWFLPTIFSLFFCNNAWKCMIAAVLFKSIHTDDRSGMRTEIRGKDIYKCFLACVEALRHQCSKMYESSNVSIGWYVSSPIVEILAQH